MSKNSDKLFGFLSNQSPNMVFVSILLGVLSGLAYALIIPIVTQSIEFTPNRNLQVADEVPFYIFNFEVSNKLFATAFFLLCLFILVARTASSSLLQWVAIKASRNLKLTLYKRVTLLPYSDLERIGPSRLHAAIANDVPRIIAGASAFPAILINAATIVGLLGFLVYLNINVFLFIMLTIVFGMVTYQVPLRFGNQFYSRARENLDTVQEGIRGLIYGSKELKLNVERREHFVQEALVEPEDKYASSSRWGSLLMVAALNYGNLIAFFAIGVATFIIGNHYSVAPQTLVSIVMAMLYITGPLASILNSIAPVMQGNVSLKKLNRLLDQMPVEKTGTIEDKPEIARMQLSNVELTYSANEADGDDRQFHLGPVDLTFNSGEVNFIIGGNGSGKSTLGKLLALLYTPDTGEIRFNDELVTADNIVSYRQKISAIFTDFHLFTKVYGIDNEELKKLSGHYLKYLGLEKKVSINDGVFSTINLSDGQKKRLALLVSYFEDRDIYIFDEWAADQDPQFKQVFYSEILGGLKAAGKIVLIISHDDRYFDLADKVVKVEEGKISSVTERLSSNASDVTPITANT